MKNATTRLIGAALGIGFVLQASFAFAEPIKLNWWHAMGGKLGESLYDVVDKFNKSQSDYVLTATKKGHYEAVFNAAVAAYRAGEQPHILQNNESGFLTLMLSGAVVPVQEILEKNGVTVKIDDYLGPVIKTYADDSGDIIGMPFNSSTPILFYNTDMLKAAGITNPPETWQEMADQSRKIISSGAGKCGYSFAAGNWQEIENYSLWHNIPYATLNNGSGGLKTKLVFNTTHVVGHIDRLKNWVDEGIASFGGENRQDWSSGARTRFLNGQCAFWIDSTAWHSTVQAGAKMNWNATFLPHEEGKETNSSMIGGAALYVFKGFSEEEYAGIAAFFKFLTSPEIQIFWHKATGYVPITKTAYNEVKAQGYYEKNASREYAVIQLLKGKPTENSRTIRIGNFANIRAIVTEELDKVWVGDLKAQEALDQAARRGNEVLRRFEKQNEGKL